MLRARRFYLILAGLFAIGIVCQVFFAGLGVLVDPSYFGWHTTFAHILELTLLALPVVGLFGRVGWRSFGLNALLFILFGMQYVFMYGLQGPLKALHVVNALALFWLALQLSQQAWRLTQITRVSERVYAPSGGKASVGRSVAGGIAILLGAVVLFGVIFDNGWDEKLATLPSRSTLRSARGLGVAQKGAWHGTAYSSRPICCRYRPW